MAVTKIKPIKSTLKKALEYIQNPIKLMTKCSYHLSVVAMKPQI